MAGFPWSELGLDGPADERTIRRAYAARLKIVRPDLTSTEAREVLKKVLACHNAEVGVSWDTLEIVADQLFPEPNG